MNPEVDSIEKLGHPLGFKVSSTVMQADSDGGKPRQQATSRALQQLASTLLAVRCQQMPLANH